MSLNKKGETASEGFPYDIVVSLVSRKRVVCICLRACAQVCTCIERSHVASYRYLDKEEFSRFIQRFCLLSDSTFDQFADDLLKKLSAPQSLDLTDKKVSLQSLSF